MSIRRLGQFAFFLVAAIGVVSYAYASIAASSGASPTSDRAAGLFNCYTRFNWEIQPISGNDGTANSENSWCNFQRKQLLSWVHVFSGTKSALYNNAIPDGTWWNEDTQVYSQEVNLQSGKKYRWEHGSWRITGNNIGGSWSEPKHQHSEVDVE